MEKKPHIHTASDQDLVKETLENKEAFREIINRYQNPVLNFIKRISSCDDQSSQDIAQDAFVSAYVGLSEYDRALPFKSWLFRIARNKAIDRFRRVSIRQEVPIDNTEAFNIPIDEIEFKDSIDDDSKRKSIIEAMKKLRQEYREILVMRYYEDLGYNEISDILMRPEQTIRTMANRARNELKEKLNDSIKQEYEK